MSDTATKGTLQIDVAGLNPPDAVAKIIEYAAGLHASDLFFTAAENGTLVQIRHHGILRPLTTLPLETGRRCLSHIKAAASMDLAERRRPTDGRWIYRQGSGSMLDLRINTIPTMHGEDCTLRLLPRDRLLLPLNSLGLLHSDYNQLLSLLSSPSGLILVTGPTGSGKTTTLYACLGFLNNGQRKINTIEDPVEYAIAGFCQSQINPRIDLGFAELLRSVLRQAPDVIMVGEIRDAETAEIAVRAANSGHLVLATLHTPVAAGAIQSLLHLGVHSHFLAGALLGVLAQRLVRTLCPECKVATDLDESMQPFAEVQRWLEPGQGKVFYAPKGCPKCHQFGYAGRTGVFEVLPVGRDMRKMILERQPVQALHRKAVEDGMIEFRLSALLKIAQGQSSFEEVFRVIPTQYLQE